MITKISSQEVPDLFYVNAEYAPEWIDQGFLEPLDDYIAKAGFDTSQFFEGYLSTFKGKDGKIYGLPKDGNTIAMAYNSDIVTAAPTTMDELVTAGAGAQGYRTTSRRRSASTLVSTVGSRSCMRRAVNW